MEAVGGICDKGLANDDRSANQLMKKYGVYTVLTARPLAVSGGACEGVLILTPV